MWAVGTMNEDYLGYLDFPIESRPIIIMLTNVVDPWPSKLLPHEGIGRDGGLDMPRPRNGDPQLLHLLPSSRFLEYRLDEECAGLRFLGGLAHVD